MTVEEALKCWCPYARTWAGVVAGVNRTREGEPSPGTRCIADACMAWRWEQVETDVRQWVNGATCGSCGLAGAE